LVGKGCPELQSAREKGGCFGDGYGAVCKADLETDVAAIKPSDCGGAKVGEELFPGIRGSVGNEVVEGVGVKVLQLVLKIGCRAGGREVGVVRDW
jgi:hypothetical protein